MRQTQPWDPLSEHHQYKRSDVNLLIFGAYPLPPDPRPPQLRAPRGGQAARPKMPSHGLRLPGCCGPRSHGELGEPQGGGEVVGRC